MFITVCSCLQCFCNPSWSLSTAVGNPVHHSAMTKWRSYFWHFSSALIQEEHCKRIVQPTECHENTWHAAPNPLDVDPAATPGVFCSNSVFQQFICKMPEVCPEHTWNPQCHEELPQRGASFCCSCSQHPFPSPSLPSKLHRYHCTLQILLLPISTSVHPRKASAGCNLGFIWLVVFYFGYTPPFILSINRKKICNLWLLL